MKGRTQLAVALVIVIAAVQSPAVAVSPADTLPELSVRSYIPSDLPGYRMMGEIEGLQPVDRQMSPNMTDRAYTEYTRENRRVDVNSYGVSFGAYRYETSARARERTEEVLEQGATWRDTIRGLPVIVARETETLASVGTARYYLSYHQGTLALRVWSTIGVIDGAPPTDVAQKTLYQAFRVMVERARASNESSWR